MKKIVIFFVIVLATVAVARADKYTIKRDALPDAAQEMLSTYFPNAKVSLIKVDRHLLKKTDYDVKLVNGTKIEFNNAGKWTSVDCKTRELPDGLLLRPIRTYIKKNYPGVKAVKVEKKSSGYEVELSDGIELKFNLLGTFRSVKMDD